LVVVGGVTALRPGLPVVAGSSEELLFNAVASAGTQGDFQVFRSPDWLVGAASVEMGRDLEKATFHLYEQLIALTPGLRLARIWNYVPAINAAGPDGLENYRAFCLGRARAFEAQLGAQFKTQLPAASAVGCQSGRVSVLFAATPHDAQHVENPQQTPAYEYPAEYGPRPPSFARATVVRAGPRRFVFLSGTAAVRGHLTVAPYQTGPQLECTLENLRTIAAQCGRESGVEGRFVKVYLRHRSDHAAVADGLRREFLLSGDRVTYVEADICRSDLHVEIEVTAGLP
jgi:chorismate lyase / 3-hydroxybenzoate synthase